MKPTLLAKIVIVCAAAFAAVTGAEAKGNLSVSLTIVSSCAVSSAHAYRAALPGGSQATMAHGCSADASYTVSVSSAAKAGAAASRDEAVVRTQGDAEHVVVTLTY